MSAVWVVSFCVAVFAALGFVVSLIVEGWRDLRADRRETAFFDAEMARLDEWHRRAGERRGRPARAERGPAP